MTEITQADRDAAASAYYAWFDGSPVIPTRMKQGQVDHHTMIQDFARHRMEERAAIVAWLRRYGLSVDYHAAADEIEAGEHLK